MILGHCQRNDVDEHLAVGDRALAMIVAGAHGPGVVDFVARTQLENPDVLPAEADTVAGAEPSVGADDAAEFGRGRTGIGDGVDVAVENALHVESEGQILNRIHGEAEGGVGGNVEGAAVDKQAGVFIQLGHVGLACVGGAQPPALPDLTEPADTNTDTVRPIIAFIGETGGVRGQSREGAETVGAEALDGEDG